MKIVRSPLVRGFVQSAVILTAWIALATGLRANPEWSSQQKEVWKNVETYWALDAAGDTQAFLTYFHADYQGWSYANVLPGSKERAAKFITYSHKTSKTLVYDLQPVAVRVHDNIAYAHYLWTRVAKDAEGKEKREGSVRTLQQKGGSW